MSSSWDSVLLEMDEDSEDNQFPLLLTISIICMGGMALGGLYAFVHPQKVTCEKEEEDLDDINDG